MPHSLNKEKIIIKQNTKTWARYKRQIKIVRVVLSSLENPMNSPFDA